MSADILCRAAALMRERAEAALDTEASDRWYSPLEIARVSDGQVREEDSAYIASWHPLVALAVADWLDLVARLLDEGFDPNAETKAALAVARAYLGEPS